MGKEDVLKNIEASRNSPGLIDWYFKRSNFIENASISGLQKLDSFPVFTSRQIITRFLVLYELFKLIVEIPGSIIECGVGRGLGLMSFAHFASIFEPYHYTRKIVGFDTFEGFTEPMPQDLTSFAAHMKKGGLNYGSYEVLKEAIGLYDENRPIGHMQKVELVKGDLSETLPEYLNNNPYLVVAMLYLDVDLYKPTLDAIAFLTERLVKGSIIVFDEINHKDYPGETIAVMEKIGLPNLRLRRLSFASTTSYAIFE